MDAASRITERLTTSESGIQNWLWVPLVRLLAHGEPVAVAEIAAATERSEDEVRAALAAAPDTEYDDAGRVVGLGLTLRPTPHRFEVDGEQLYTWCALDTLILPTVLGRPARIESAYEGGTPVRVSVDSSEAVKVEPATAVVSLVDPDDLSSVRSSFCSQVLFFATEEDARPWLEAHPGGAVMPLAQAHQAAAEMAARMLADPAAAPEAGRGTPTCAC